VAAFLHVANRQTFAKAILSFLGFIVQQAIMGEIDPDTAAKKLRLRGLQKSLKEKRL
jgi:hypothetical protein